MPAWLAIGGAVVVGALTAVQARVNGQLGVRLGDGVAAGLIAFGSGAAILVVLSVALPAGRRGLVALVSGLRARATPWWLLAGGVAGALTNATQGLTVGLIGVSLFTVGVVAGQTLGGLALDRAGYGPAGVVAVTIPRVAGGALALVAVLLALTSEGTTGAPWWMLALPFLAGVGISWQQATNGRLRQRVGSALTATLVNFVGGTVVLAAAEAVRVAVTGPPGPLPAELWVYTGGAIGVTYIFLSAALVRYTGVLLFGLGSVVGLLATSVVLDSLWPAPASPGPATELTMVGVALASVAVAAAPWRRRRRR